MGFETKYIKCLFHYAIQKIGPQLIHVSMYIWDKLSLFRTYIDNLDGPLRLL